MTGACGQGRSMMTRLLATLVPFCALVILSAAQPAAPRPFALHRLFDQAGPGRTEARLPDAPTAPPLYMEDATLLDEKALEYVRPQLGVNGRWDIIIGLTPAGAKEFFKITTANEGRRLGIVLAGQLVSAPVIREPIPGPSLVISGNFTEQSAREFAAKFEAAKP